jgi:hypothetical protein
VSPEHCPPGADPAEVDALSRRIDALERAAGRLSALRLASFAAIVAGIVGAVNGSIPTAALGLAALVSFAAAVVRHGTVLDERDRAGSEKLAIEESLERRRTRRRARPAPPPPPDEGTPLEMGRRVRAPEPESHPVDAWAADDLGLLDGGGRTLFGFLDWSSTAFGSRRLRHVLLNPLRKAGDIRVRQEAVAEMARKPEALRGITLCFLPLRKHSLDPAARFLAEPPVFAGRAGILIWANLLGTAIPAVIIAAAAAGSIDVLALLVPLIALSLVTIGLNVKRANPTRDRLLLFGPLLDAWLRLREALAGAAPSSAEWRGIAGAVEAVAPHARRLRRLVALLELHSYGVLFELWNLLTLWELRILPLAEGLFDRQRKLLEEASGALGEAEALLSLALPLAEQPDFEMPEVLERESPILAADEIGHPLIEPGSSMRNPIQLGDGTNVLIITGSNMSGKSTYLKSIGLNAVLAGAGGPACARGLRWTPLAIFTDINVRDSLEDGKSYFQVEVERVRAAIDAAERSPFTLAIFDELFRGTNSEERSAIARAILRRLRSSGTLAAVATHDLGLARAAAGGAEPGMENKHFREHVEDGRMAFDYCLREGPAPTRNAIRVLEASGYPEGIIAEARAEMGPGST